VPSRLTVYGLFTGSLFSIESSPLILPDSSGLHHIPIVVEFNGEIFNGNVIDSSI